MAESLGIYKCELCGNIVEVLHAGGGELVCCGQPMTQQKENTVDASQEKHVPVIERDGSSVKVSVGSVLHPMTEEHHIQWIELLADDEVLRKSLKPGGEPVAVFESIKSDTISARAYCNQHGLWQS